MKKYLALLLAVLMLTAMVCRLRQQGNDHRHPRRFYRNGRARQD